MTNLNKTNKHRHPEFISGSTRHCEQSEAISSRLPRATALAMTNETGRSMVEMLGVLAVIGVLSITGISGYTTAMNKHKANEILDAASKRAVAVSTQIQRGNTSPTLDEFGDETAKGVSFSLKATDGNAWATGQSRFALQTSAIDEDICRELYNIIGTSGTVREIYSNAVALSSSSGCSETASAMRFVYNNDLTNTATASDYKTQSDCKSPYTWCTELNKCQNTGDACVCPANSEYEATNGDSTKQISGTKCYCKNGYNLEDGACVVDATLQWCGDVPKPGDENGWACGASGWSCDGYTCTHGPDKDKCMEFCECDSAPGGGDGWFCDEETGEIYCQDILCETGPDAGTCQSNGCRCGTAPAGDGWECDTPTSQPSYYCNGIECESGPDEGKCMIACGCDTLTASGDGWRCDGEANPQWKCTGGTMCTDGPDAGKCMVDCDCGTEPAIGGDGWECSDTGKWTCPNYNYIQLCTAGPDAGKCVNMDNTPCTCTMEHGGGDGWWRCDYGVSWTCMDTLGDDGTCN